MSENRLQALFQSIKKVSRCVQTHLSQIVGLSNHKSPTNGQPLFSLSSSANPSRSNANSVLLQPKDSLREGKSTSPVTKEQLGRATWTFLHTLAAQYPDNPTRQQKKDVKELALFQTFEKVSRCVQTHLSQFIGLSNLPSPTNGQPLFSLSSSANPSRSYMNSVLLLQPKDSLSEGKSTSPVTKEQLGRATWTFLHTLAAQMSILSRMHPCKECADHFKEVLRSNPVQAGSQAEFSQWLCHVHNVVNRSLGKLVFPCERVGARWGKLECEQRA